MFNALTDCFVQPLPCDEELTAVLMFGLAAAAQVSLLALLRPRPVGRLRAACLRVKRNFGVWIGSVLSGLVLAAGLWPAPAGAAEDAWRGKAAPEFSLKTLDGRTVKLAELRGKVVLLNFWATWCGPCKVEIPWLNDFSTRYRQQGLEVVGVSMDNVADRDDSEKVAAFAREMKMNYTVLLHDDAVKAAYGGLRYMPQTFMVGRDGRIISADYGIRTKAAFEADVLRALGR